MSRAVRLPTFRANLNAE
ncbi:unnamed protein product, partial [Adineta ricciae]